jgi:hypothetical protein
MNKETEECLWCGGEMVETEGHDLNSDRPGEEEAKMVCSECGYILYEIER